MLAEALALLAAIFILQVVVSSWFATALVLVTALVSVGASALICHFTRVAYRVIDYTWHCGAQRRSSY